MTRVTANFRIASPVPFVDVHVERDNPLYLDPSAIRNSSGKYARRADGLLVSYFTEVLRLRASRLVADHRAGLALLQDLHEPNQTRLGVTKNGVGGKAIGPGIADELWDELGRNPAARHAALTRLEHLPIYLDRVGPDLISDLATRVVFEVLADFTAEMMRIYPALASVTTTAETRVYDPVARRWVGRQFQLPYVDSHQLLLIPKEWVYWRLLMWAEPFYNRFATATVQLERRIYDEVTKKFFVPTKKQLGVEFENHRRLNNDQAVKYMEEQQRNLTLEYQGYVDGTFEPLADDELTRRTD